MNHALLSTFYGIIGGMIITLLMPSPQAGFGGLNLSTVGTSTIPVSLGVGTTSAITTLEVYHASATSSARLDTGGTRGGCLTLKDADGAGYSYFSANNGTLVSSANSCY